MGQGVQSLSGHTVRIQRHTPWLTWWRGRWWWWWSDPGRWCAHTAHILHSRLVLDWFWPAVSLARYLYRLRPPGGITVFTHRSRSQSRPEATSPGPVDTQSGPEARQGMASLLTLLHMLSLEERLDIMVKSKQHQSSDYNLVWQVCQFCWAVIIVRKVIIWRRVCSSSINWIEIRVVFKVKTGRIIRPGEGQAIALSRPVTPANTGNTKPRQSILSNSIKFLRWSCWLVVADSGWSYYSQFATFVTSQPWRGSVTSNSLDSAVMSQGQYPDNKQ